MIYFLRFLRVVGLLLALAGAFFVGRGSLNVYAAEFSTPLLAPKLQPGCWYTREQNDVRISCPEAYEVKGLPSLVPACQVTCVSSSPLNRFVVRDYRLHETPPPLLFSAYISQEEEYRYKQWNLAPEGERKLPAPSVSRTYSNRR